MDLFLPAASPVPENFPSLGRILRTMKDNMLEIVPRAAYRESIITARVGYLRWHVVTGPELLKRIFLDNVDNYPKAPIMHRMLEPYLGESIFLAQGESWRWQRRTLAGMFQRKKLAVMLPEMQRCAQRIVQRMLAEDDFTNMSAHMRQVTMDVVRSTMFTDIERIMLDHMGVSEADARVMKGDWESYKAGMDANLVAYLGKFGKPSLMELLNLPKWLARPGAYSANPMNTGPRELVEAAIAARRRSGDLGEDLAGLMLRAEDPETGRRMSDAEIRDNLLTFIMAGFETTALALTWTLYIAAHHPPTQVRLQEEAEAALTAPDPVEQLEKLVFTRRVLEEVMRLYPPAPHLYRRARAADELGGVRIGRRDMILAPIYTLHRHEALWERPDHFDPERFAADKGAERHRFQYLPFGAGPRVCIGPMFAMMEAAIILAEIMAHVTLLPHPDFPIRPAMRLTLRPIGGMPLKAIRRISGVASQSS